MVVARAQILPLPQFQLPEDELGGNVVLERPGSQLQTTTVVAHATAGHNMRFGRRTEALGTGAVPGRLVLPGTFTTV